ncbi:hypothetical protein [Sphingomonas psychrolutea]|uniref:ABC transmembrane type-1 domain-containing protein n=1 Tax=Sphingomonas psychrolutea TaxID=1259676 RepID=A0ABQ1GQX4_9SPHN|nr:hypothetical protein [Sphingomonas psychrolutea]GGA48669.1 hypothetical protein GCM10011395_18790 [Sphingomonas psychrolutea]
MRPNTLRLLRRYHHYLGLFFAPMILLFAISGALQTFRLQEAKGYGGPPPNWIVWLASVHKDQGPPREPRAEKPKPAGEAAKPRVEAPRTGPKRPSPLPLKIFVVLLAIALAISTIMGIVIALANRAMRRVSIVLLMLGTVVPIVLLWV